MGYSTFMGLETAYRGLMTSQTALNVAGQNVSNAGTAGYSRQIANIATTIPLTINQNSKDISIGSGSNVETITRIRDAYIDQQFRRETSKYEYWSGKEATLSLVEGVLNETSDYSLNNDLSEFWNAWSELGNNPEETSARVVVKEKALTLVETFQNIDRQITDLGRDQDNSVEVSVKKINTIGDQIRELNIRIKTAEVKGDNPNDLKDRRDALVDELAQYVPVKVIESEDTSFTDRQVGNYTVVIGNASDPKNILVDNNEVRHLQEDPVPTGSGYKQVVWEDDYDEVSGTYSAKVDLGSNMGSLQANLEIRDEYLVQFRADIDSLASALAEAVNTIHQTGQGLTGETGLDFFTSTDGTAITAANITVNPDIEDNVQRIATGASTGTDPVESGDGSIALAISSLASSWDSYIAITGGTAPLNTNSLQDYYGALVSKMGSNVAQSTRMTEGENVLIAQLTSSRESVSGVSLDEEMVNLIKYQKGYSSAARVVTILDSVLDSLLGMGVTR